ncbi:MAG TPA: hypothetical protein VH575_20865 [Gemmataceae bacterium]|jgi:hypothetical protein
MLCPGGDVGLRPWDVATGKDLGWFPTAAPATARFTADGSRQLVGVFFSQAGFRRRRRFWAWCKRRCTN